MIKIFCKDVSSFCSCGALESLFYKLRNTCGSMLVTLMFKWIYLLPFSNVIVSFSVPLSTRLRPRLTIGLFFIVCLVSTHFHDIDFNTTEGWCYHASKYTSSDFEDMLPLLQYNVDFCRVKSVIIYSEFIQTALLYICMSRWWYLNAGGHIFI